MNMTIQIDKILTQINDITAELKQSLSQNEDWDGVIDKLKERQALIELLEESMRRLDESTLANAATIKAGIDAILARDSENSRQVNLRIDETSDALAQIARQRASIEHLHTISKNRRKKIVNFLC